MKPLLIARPITAEQCNRLREFIGNRSDEDILSGKPFAFYDDDPPTKDSPALKPALDFNDLLVKAHNGDAAATMRYRLPHNASHFFPVHAHLDLGKFPFAIAFCPGCVCHEQSAPE